MPKPRIEPRKRPRQRRGEATVAAILEAAAHILEERGLEGFNTNAVAERAGASIGSLYQYFPNKDALTAALIRQHAERLLASLDDAVSHTRRDDLDRSLAALARVAVAQQLARPRLARLLDAEEARLPLDEDTRRTAIAIRRRIETVLARSGVDLDTAEFRTAAEDLLHVARGLIDGAAHTDASTPGDLELRVLAAIRGYLRERGLYRSATAQT